MFKGNSGETQSNTILCVIFVLMQAFIEFYFGPDDWSIYQSYSKWRLHV